MSFNKLRKFLSIPSLLNVFIKGVIVITQKCSCSLLSLSSPHPLFLISFQSLVGHQDDLRKEEALGCCAVTPSSALWAFICPLIPPVCSSALVMPLLFWHKLCSTHFDLLCWFTVSWCGVSDFLSLFFRIQIPFSLYVQVSYPALAIIGVWKA